MYVKIYTDNLLYIILVYHLTALLFFYNLKLKLSKQVNKKIALYYFPQK